jgi:transcriptional regulator with XRE-family HTH domain
MAAYTPSEEKLTRLLRKLREERGLTQIALGERVDEPQQVVSKIERGDRRLYATQLFEYVEKGFGMTVVEFARRYEKAK